MSLTKLANNCFNVSFETGVCERQATYGEAGRSLTLNAEPALGADPGVTNKGWTPGV